MLLIYREANDQLGFELIGLWSILTAISSLGGLGAFGFAGSLMKYSAELQAKNDLKSLPGLVNTSFLILSAGLLIVLAFMYILALLFLDLVVDVKYLDLAFSLLPFSFLIFYVSIMGQTILSVVEGLNKNWQKNTVLLFGHFIFMIATLWLLPELGLKGLLLAQLTQVVFVFVAGLTILRLNLPAYLPYLFSRDKVMIGEVVRYGLKFQSQTILHLLFEPITKMLFSRYGGLSYVGVFELASRIVVQVRSVLLAIVTNLLPKLIHLHVLQTQEDLNKTFKQLFRINFDLFIITFGGFGLLTALILNVWLGNITGQLLHFTYFLTIGWWINSISLIPYMFNLGSGKLNTNVMAHGIISGLNLLLGAVIIILKLEAICFLYAFVLSMSVGSLYILYEYIRRNSINGWSLLTIHHIKLLLFLAILTICGRTILISPAVDEYFGYIVLISMYLLLSIIYLRMSGTYFMIMEYLRSFIGFRFMAKNEKG